MDRGIIAVIFQEGGRLLSELLRNRPRKYAKLPVEYPPITMGETDKETEETTTIEKKAKEIATGCVPCAIGHYGTCSGLLNEAMRFAKRDGVGSSEVIDRINICLDELNAMERVDLRPELIASLPDWEKKLADKALTESRQTRHVLEEISTIDALEKIAANTQTVRREIGKEWFKQRLAKMPKEEKAKLAEEAIEKLEKET